MAIGPGARSRPSDKMRTLRYGIIPYAAILGIIGGLMWLEPHFSGLVLIVGIGAAMMYAGGIHRGWVIAGVLAVGVVAYCFFTGVITYNSGRIPIWLDPLNEKWMKEGGYQIKGMKFPFHTPFHLGDDMHHMGIILYFHELGHLDSAKF